MDEIIKYFSESGSFLSFVFALVILAAIIKVFEKVYGWASKKLTAYYNFRKGKDQQSETISEQDRKITEIDDKLSDVMAKMDNIVVEFREHIKHQKKVNTVVLKDKINIIYKDCLIKGYILDKAKHDFKDAFDEYVANGGNSYVIDEIEPYIHGLKTFLSDEDAKSAGY